MMMNKKEHYKTFMHLKFTLLKICCISCATLHHRNKPILSYPIPTCLVIVCLSPILSILINFTKGNMTPSDSFSFNMKHPFKILWIMHTWWGREAQILPTTMNFWKIYKITFKRYKYTIFKQITPLVGNQQPKYTIYKINTYSPWLKKLWRDNSVFSTERGEGGYWPPLSSK